MTETLPNLPWTLTFAGLRECLQGAGLPFFERGDYNLNLIGVRSGIARAGYFDDWILAAFRAHGADTVLAFEATTDPGTYYLREPMHVRGTAILAEGHHRNLWRIGRHQNRYTALVQDQPATVYRDANRDDTLQIDLARPHRGLFGINLHKADTDTDYVGKWSAGCQVIKRPEQFELLMALCAAASPHWGPVLSYTLIPESTLNGL